jgi:hypothetical protein
MGTDVIFFPLSSKTVTRLSTEPGGGSAVISRAMTSAFALAFIVSAIKAGRIGQSMTVC